MQKIIKNHQKSYGSSNVQSTFTNHRSFGMWCVTRIPQAPRTLAEPWPFSWRIKETAMKRQQQKQICWICVPFNSLFFNVEGTKVATKTRRCSIYKYDYWEDLNPFQQLLQRMLNFSHGCTGLMNWRDLWS